MHGVRFELERFQWDGARLEVAGRWHGLAGGRLGHSTLTVEVDGRRRRVAAVAEEEPHRAAAGETWWAWFPWVGDAREVKAAELEVGRNLVIELPRPDVRARDEGPTPPEVALAHERAEVRRLRKQLAAVREEAAHALERERGETARVREELTFVNEREAAGEAERERLGGELEAGKEAAAEAERLRGELAAAQERAGEVERLRGELEAAQERAGEVELLRGELAGTKEQGTEVERLRGELERAGEEAQRRQLELASSLAEERATAERLRKELESNGTDGGKATPLSLRTARRGDTSEAPTARSATEPAPHRRGTPPRRPRPAAHHRTPPSARAERSRGHAPWPVRIAAAGLLILLFATLVLLVDSLS